MLLSRAEGQKDGIRLEPEPKHWKLKIDGIRFVQNGRDGGGGRSHHPPSQGRVQSEAALHNVYGRSLQVYRVSAHRSGKRDPVSVTSLNRCS